jgi:hypothetical protein
LVFENGVSKRKFIPSTSFKNNQQNPTQWPEWAFPINFLRNVAISRIRTDLFMYIEADFLPSPNLFSYILSVKNEIDNKEFAAFVVMGFEDAEKKLGLLSASPSLSFTMPFNKQKLLENRVSLGIDRIHYRTHARLPWKTWEQLPSDNILLLAKEEVEEQEPYYVMKTTMWIPYDEIFMGCGFDKFSQLIELRAAQYQFYLLPEGYILHLEPQDSSTPFRRKKWCINYDNPSADLKNEIFYERISWMYSAPPSHSRFRLPSEDFLHVRWKPQKICTPLIHQISLPEGGDTNHLLIMMILAGASSSVLYFVFLRLRNRRFRYHK